MKKLFAMFVAVLVAGVAMAQLPIVTPLTISKVGTDETVDASYFTIYNTGGTSSLSYVTIVSDSTNLFTVGTASATISNNYEEVTVTYATGLAAGNYSGNILVTQTNAPVTVRTIPVTLRITKDQSLPLGSLADIRVLRGNIGATPQVVPRKYGDVLIGKYTVVDQAGTSTDYMNVWVSKGITTNDWESLGGQIYTAVTLAAQQRDTNATTSATAYTPRYVGDLLIGQAGSGTGAMWVATGVTTNDWEGPFKAISTASVTKQTVTGYDATGAALTNSAGGTIAIVTNVTVALSP